MSRSRAAEVPAPAGGPIRQILAVQLIASMSSPEATVQERARKIFIDQGYLDEAIKKLRSSNSAAERAVAAHALGIVGSRQATAHLVAGLFDNAADVCQAAAEALSRIGDPAVAIDPLELLSSESNQRIIDRPKTGAVPEFRIEPELITRAQENQFHVAAEPDAALPEQDPPHPLSAEPARAMMACEVADVPPEILADLNSLIPEKRIEALGKLTRSGAASAFKLITNSFNDVSPEVRNAAARALYDLEAGRGAEYFGRAIEEGSPDQCRNIGGALVGSGLADSAINDLGGDSREAARDALCLLLVMAKAGEIQPLIQAIERHQSVEVRCAAVRLLTLNGQSEIAAEAAKRRLMVRRT